MSTLPKPTSSASAADKVAACIVDWLTLLTLPNPTSPAVVLAFKALLVVKSVPPIVTVPLNPAVPSVSTKKAGVWILPLEHIVIWPFDPV